MTAFIGKHAFAITAVAGMMFGLVGGGDALWKIHQYETHTVVQAKGGNHGHH